MRDPLGEDEHGDRIAAPEESVLLEVEELAAEVFEAAPTPQELVLVGPRPPVGIVIGEDDEADHGSTPEFDQAVVVPIHPEGHLGVAMGLGLGVEQDILRRAIDPGDPDEAIQMLTTVLGIMGDLPEFGVEVDRGFGPVDAPEDRALAQLEEWAKEEFPGLLPGGIEVGDRVRHPGIGAEPGAAPPSPDLGGGGEGKLRVEGRELRENARS